MAKMVGSSSRRSDRGDIEENTLAILDATDSKDTRDANDDRIAYLEAVRAASILPENGTRPTNKMYEAVFRILRYGKSMELIMASFQLLNELEKFPRICISEPSLSNSHELEVVNEAWSPFVFNTDVPSSDREAAARNSSGLFDFSCFHLLMQDLTEVTNETNFCASDTKFLGKMLLLQYLVNVLEGDFLPRNSGYAETMNWKLLRESLLNKLLASRRINYKGLIKDCLSTFCGLYQVHATAGNNCGYPNSSVVMPSESFDTGVAIGLLEVQKTTCMAVQKLLIVIMELDASKKKADLEASTTRGDGARTPLVEIILDELTYNEYMISPFLQAFNDPKWKLQIILDYFSKYTAKPSVRTRRSNGSTEDSTFSGVLKCFSDKSRRNISKKISTDIIQLLLAHAFQAHLVITSQKDVGGIIHLLGGSSLVEICNNIISAFRSLRRMDQKMEILPVGKEALFTAATVLSGISE